MKNVRFLIILLAITAMPSLFAQYERDSTTINFEIECGFDPGVVEVFPPIVTTGTKKLTVILVSSPDAPDHPKLPINEVTMLRDDLENYFSSMSGGEFNLLVDIVVQNPTPVAGKVTLFSLPNNFDPAVPMAGFDDVLSDVDDVYDYNDADYDQDGYADHICIVIAKFSPLTPAKLYGEPLIGTGTFETKDITQYGTTSGFVEIQKGSIAHNYSATQNNYYDRFTILQHELTHSLFHLPDIEHGMGDPLWYAFGAFDGSIGFRFGNYPAYWNPQFREYLGWITINEVNTAGTITLSDFESSGNFPVYSVQPQTANNEKFWITYYDVNNYTNNIFLNSLPLNDLVVKKGCLIWRRRTLNSYGTAGFGFLDRREASLTLESASGKWEWKTINAGTPNAKKYREQYSDGRFIPNITNGLDSLQQRGSYIWLVGDTWFGTYPDLRVGSFTNYFKMDQSQDFAFYTNPSSNLSRYSVTGFPLDRTSGLALKNFRIENNLAKVDVALGAASYIVSKSSTIKAENLEISGDVIIDGSNASLQVLPGSSIKMMNQYSIFAENGGTFKAENTTFNFMNPGNRNALYAIEGGNLILHNCTITNAEKGVRVNRPGRIELVGNTINNEYGTVELWNLSSTPALLQGNTIINNASYGYGLMASGNIPACSLSLINNTINAGSGIALYNIGNVQIGHNNIAGRLILGSKGLYLQSISEIYATNNQIHHFDLGLSLAGTTAKLHKNKIYSNLWHGIEIKSNSLASMAFGLEQADGMILRMEGCNECYNNGNKSAYVLENSEIKIGTVSSNLRLNYEFPGFNSIYESRNNPNIPNSVLIYNAAPSSLNNSLNAIHSYWGGESPENRFYPYAPTFSVSYIPFRTVPFFQECSLNTSNPYVLYDYENNVLDTLYKEVPQTVIGLTALDSLFAFATTYEYLGDYEAAKEAYSYIIENYAEDPQVVEAYHRFLNCLNLIHAEQSEYNDFYEELNTTILNGAQTEIELYLQRLSITTGIYLGNYESANTYLDSIINNSQSQVEILDAEFEQIMLSMLMQSSQQSKALTPAETRNYSLNTMDYASDRIKRILQKSSDIDSDKNKTMVIPLELSLSENYPNPFNPSTNIRFGIHQRGYVSVKVYDVLGKEVKTLINEEMEPGSYSVIFNGSEYSSGIYLYELKLKDQRIVKKMTLVK
ncbi:MAG: right-handed parallel beta-helix repeat-containing protein [Ignavibacteriaceae bacterium]|nr:right-handed parallel beta-helix repeat-containing protein [Ignavibacteriaceae bacterium]